MARALNAWKAYGTSLVEPIDIFNQGLPRKQTLQDVWATAAKKRHSSQSNSDRSSSAQAAFQPTNPASDRQPLQTGASAQSMPAEATGSAGQAFVSASRQRDVERAREAAYDSAGSRQLGAPSGGQEQPEGPKAPANAFSVLMSSTKTPPMAVIQRPQAGRPPFSRSGFAARLDILHQVALHPERWVP